MVAAQSLLLCLLDLYDNDNQIHIRLGSRSVGTAPAGLIIPKKSALIDSASA
jgi:hypothetical protein